IALVGFGYALIFHAAGGGGFYESLYYSASSISTLGFAEPPPRDVMLTMLTVFEAMSSAVTISLLIGYLPNVYSAYREREQAVMRLDAEVGDAASGVNILEQLAAPAGLDHLDPIWGDWSGWFAGVAASHQTISGALFLRSPGGRTSWLATAGGVLDAAAIALAALQPTPPQAAKIERCLSTGARALWLIADALHLRVDPNPAWPATPITVTQAEFGAALDALQQAGLPVAAERDAAWQAFARRRVAYDATLVALCRVKMVRPGCWSEAQGAARHWLPLPIRRHKTTPNGNA
ncbi:MAG TPA: potassium channel family protein, partial [Thermomicrobiales bacterium]|nr:potassium channel family protein [Thermomicrobiales bacterium]